MRSLRCTIVVTTIFLAAGCGSADRTADAADAAGGMAHALGLPFPWVESTLELEPLLPWMARLPAMASDGRDFLVVYFESRGEGPSDLWGVRLGIEAGALHRASDPFLLAAAVDPSEGPASVAWDGERYLVTYVANDPEAQFAPVHLLLLDRDGAVLDGPYTLGTTPRRPDVACAAGRCLVVWAAPLEIGIAPVDQAGPGVQTSIASRSSDAPAVTTDGTDFAIGWRSFDTLKIVRVDAAGQAIDPAPLSVIGASNWLQFVDVDAAQGAYLVLWRNYEPYATDRILARRLSQDGTWLDAQPIPIAAVRDYVNWPSLTHDGSGWVLHHQDQSYKGQIRFLRIAPDGSIDLTGEQSPLAPSADVQDRSAGTWSGTSSIAAWQSTSWEGEMRLFATMLPGAAGGSSGGLEISSRQRPATPAQWDPTLACAAGAEPGTWTEALAWREEGPGGAELRVQGRPAIAAPAGEVAPAMAMTGGEGGPTLLVHATAVEGAAELRYELRVAETTRTGVLDTGAGFRELAAAPMGHDAFLTVWSEGAGPAAELSLRRVALDPAAAASPIVVLAQGAVSGPALAHDGSTTLVAWKESGPDGDAIRASRVTADGLAADAGGFVIASGPGRRSSPSVTSSGQGWLVVWTEESGASETQVRARAIGADGSPAAEVWTVIAGEGAREQARAVWDGAFYLVAWVERPWGELRAVMMRTDGALGDVFPLDWGLSATSRFDVCRLEAGSLAFVYAATDNAWASGIDRLREARIRTWRQAYANMSVSPWEGGTIRSDPPGQVWCGQADPGGCYAPIDPASNLTLVAVPEPGFVFSGWTGSCIGTDPCVLDPQMGDASAWATFSRAPLELSVRVEGNGAGFVASYPDGIWCDASAASCSSLFTAGAYVQLSAVPEPGSTFLGWSGPCLDGPGSTLPWCDVSLESATTVTARFGIGELVTVRRVGAGDGSIRSEPAGLDCGDACRAMFPAGTHLALQAIPAPGSYFAGWAFGTPLSCTGVGECEMELDVSGPVELVAEFEPGPTIVVQKAGHGAGIVRSDPSGIDCGPTCEAAFVPGRTVRLEAIPDLGSVFAGWDGLCYWADTTCEVGAPAALKPIFEPGAIVAVQKVGAGSGRVTSERAGIDCGDVCAATFYIYDRVVLTFTPDPGNAVEFFTGCNPIAPDACELIALSLDEVFVSFVPAVTLQITRRGGAADAGVVWDDFSKQACDAPTCTRDVAFGTSVQLWPEPSPDAVFTGWGGACTGTGECIVRMDEPREVEAWFAPAVPLTLTVSGTGGKIVSSIGLTCSTGTCGPASLELGSQVTLSASITTSTGVFLGWSGACSGTQQTCVVTMDGAKAVTATFDRRVRITASVSGAGFATSQPAGLSRTTTSAMFSLGTQVTLVATPFSGGSFVSWSGACTGTAPTCTLSASQNVSVLARFDPTRVGLSVAKAGTGAGAVQSQPTGINCGATCDYAFPTGTPVALYPVLEPGSRFVGWSGACSGSAVPCRVTLTAARMVTATFQPY